VVVLDEADKMLSLGFEPQLTRLRRRLCPPQSRAPPSYQRPQVAHRLAPTAFFTLSHSYIPLFMLPLSMCRHTATAGNQEQPLRN